MLGVCTGKEVLGRLFAREENEDDSDSYLMWSFTVCTVYLILG
jgi:hypothetical protein